MGYKIFTYFVIIIICICLLIFVIDILPALFLKVDGILEEQQRILSPDGKVEALLTIYDVGAMSSAQYIVFVVPSGTPLEKISASTFLPVFEASRIENLEIIWLEEKQLLIKFKKADIFGFRNKYYPFGPEDSSYIVNIREEQVSGVSPK